MRNKKIGIGAIGLLLFFAPSAYACPLCKDAVAKIGTIWVSLGFNWSIFFMLSVPFVLIAAFTGVLYFNYRKHNV